MKRSLVLLLFPVFGFCQGVMTSPQTALNAVNGITSALSNATVTVCAASASGIPCSPAVAGTIFKDTRFTVPLSNPFTADANGNYQFSAAPGTYTVTQSGSGFSGYSYQITLGVSASANIPFSGNSTFTGSNTFKNLGAARYVSQGNPQGWGGTDVGAWANSAFSDCSNQCGVIVTAGNYTQTTTINLPVVTNGVNALVLNPGVFISYTGSSDAIFANGNNNANVGAVVYGIGARLSGTSSGVSGVHYKGFNAGFIIGLTIDTFTTGQGILIEGANQIGVAFNNINGNKDGIRSVGAVVSSVNESANANRIYNNGIANNTRYGAFEDGSKSGTVGPNLGNVYANNTFQNNGTSGVSASGQWFIQQCSGCKILNNYGEFLSGTIPQQITIGDGTFAPSKTSIRDNYFGSLGATSTINNVNGQSTLVDGNVETGAITNFHVQGSAARGSTVTNNIAAAISQANVCAGSDNGTDYKCDNSSSTLTNAFSNTIRGIGFNTVSGLTNDFRIVMRAGGSNIVNFLFSDFTSRGSISSTGQAQFNGGIFTSGAACTNGELALSAGWQSTGSATVTAVQGTGQTCSWTITTGTTTAANPTITDTLTVGLPSASVCELNIHGGTHTAAAGEGFQQTTLSATAPIFTFNGTPTAGGTTYFVTRRCGP